MSVTTDDPQRAGARHARLPVLVAALVLALLPGLATAGDPSKSEPSNGTSEVDTSVSPPVADKAPSANGNTDKKEQRAPKPRVKPKYLNLRWDEDFSYLDGPADSYQSDFFDPIKNIHLNDDWRLSLGGEFRFRLEAETNKGFGATEPAEDTFHLYRYMVHADLKLRDVFRVFAQAVAAFDEDRDLAPRGIDENRWDVQQLFFDVSPFGNAVPWTVRVGRQDLLYGKERFVSPLDWANTRRRFDGVKVFGRYKTFNLDFWFVKPVLVQRKQSDRFNEDFDFSGAYFTYKAIPRHGIDVYIFSVNDRGNARNPNGRRGDRTVHTIGSRFWGKTAGFDYETELAGQWGTWAGDTVQAWSWTLNGGYTFANVAYKPRLGAAFDYASGDHDPLDRAVQTFDQLFPLGHAYFGYLDLVGRKNIMDAQANFSAWPVKGKVKTSIAYHAFWLAEPEDALYNAAGRAVRRDPLGKSGREVGHELDVTVKWKLNVHSALLLGYSHLWDSDFIRQTGRSENADLIYVQYGFKF